MGNISTFKHFNNRAVFCRIYSDSYVNSTCLNRYLHGQFNVGFRVAQWHDRFFTWPSINNNNAGRYSKLNVMVGIGGQCTGRGISNGQYTQSPTRLDPPTKASRHWIIWISLLHARNDAIFYGLFATICGQSAGWLVKQDSWLPGSCCHPGIVEVYYFLLRYGTV